MKNIESYCSGGSYKPAHLYGIRSIAICFMIVSLSFWNDIKKANGEENETEKCRLYNNIDWSKNVEEVKKYFKKLEKVELEPRVLKGISGLSHIDVINEIQFKVGLYFFQNMLVQISLRPAGQYHDEGKMFSMIRYITQLCGKVKTNSPDEYEWSCGDTDVYLQNENQIVRNRLFSYMIVFSSKKYNQMLEKKFPPDYPECRPD